MILLLQAIYSGCFLPVLKLLLTFKDRAAVGIRVVPRDNLRLDRQTLFKSRRVYSGCTFDGIWLQEHPNLEKVVFCDCDFRSVCISDMSFDKCRFINYKFQGCEFSGVNFIGCCFEHITSRETLFTGCAFTGTHLIDWSNRSLLIGSSYFEQCKFARFEIKGLAKFSETILTSCTGLRYAQINFDKMGECGRTMTLLYANDRKVFFCGCFAGTEQGLRNYIDGNSRSPELSSTRLLAMGTLLNIANQTHTNEETNTTTK